MVGHITQSTSLNSFWSISFCVLAVCLHSYATYLGAQRYKQASARAWPGPSSKGGTPGEVSTQLILLVLSGLCLPFFVVFSFLRVGNYGNDGVKLGRDHALNPNLDAWCRQVRSQVVRRVWRNCPPLAQICYLAAAFLLLLPDTLLTAVEVEYGYKTTDSVWSTDVDFLFAEERAHMSDVMGSINLTNTVANGSRVVVPTPHPPPGGWGSDHSLSLTYVNFVLALLTFSIRYASVFWYTNKALTVVFALQLLALTLTAALGYAAWCCLYKVCYNRHVYLNVSLSLGCSTTLALYVAGGAVMLLSTMTVCEYGAHYFAEKLRIIERKHRGSQESFVKQTVVVNSGCQGYVPHSCAMAAFVALAVCKGPVIYELVALYRPTQDRLVLAGLVSEVLYLVLWIALWFGLTVKQRWQFRILDYVPLGQPLFMIHDDHVVKNPTFDRASTAGSSSGDANNSLEMREVRSRRRSRNEADSPPGYSDAVDNGSGDVTPDQETSEAGTEDSDNVNEHTGDGDCLPSLPNGPGGAMRKGRPGGRRQGGQRVTFDDHVHSNDGRASGGGGEGDPGARPSEGPRHVNVKVDVHNNVKPQGGAVSQGGAVGPSGESGAGDATDTRLNTSGGSVKLRKAGKPGDSSLSRDYRNSIRSKCDDFYAVVDHGANIDNNLNNLSPPSDPPPTATAAPSTTATTPAVPTVSVPHEPLPTLMSSFRDKVKESSRTASSYREQRRNMQLGTYGSLEKRRVGDPHHHPATHAVTNGVSSDLERMDCDKRRGIVEGEVGEVALRLDDSLDSGVRSSQRTSTVSGSEDDFQHLHPLSHPHPFSHHKHSNSAANSTLDSESSSLPSSVRENGQLGGGAKTIGGGVSGVVTDKPPRQAGGKMDYLAVGGYPRNLHIVPRTKGEIGRRDSANYSLTSSQETSSNDSDHGQGLCSQNGNAPKPK